MYYSKKFSEYILDTDLEDFPHKVILQAKKCIIDSLGCSFGGSQTKTGKIVSKTIGNFAGTGTSTIFGTGIKAPAPYAGFANGKMANILDFDDTYVGIGHPGATIVPAAFAVAEMVNASGREILKAIILAYEVSCRIGLAIQPTPKYFNYLWGMGCWQTFGAMITASVLLKLNKGQLINAFGIAGANAPVSSMRKTILTPSGLTMVKNNFGFATHTGILSAFLARDGYIGPRDIFEGETGFWRMYGSDKCEYDLLLNGLKKEYEIMKIDFKPFPMCRWCQPAVEAGIEIMKKHSLKVHELKNIVVKVALPLKEKPYSEAIPKTMEDAQFSLPFPFAVAISGYKPGPEWFSDSILNSEQIQLLSKKIEIVHDQTVDNIFPTKCIATVEITDVKDNKYSCYRESAKGSPADPLTIDEIDNKFMDLVSPILGSEKCKKLLDVLHNLENEENCLQLKDLIS